MNLPERFGEWARRQPSAPALMDGSGVLSYADVDRRSDQVARQLADGGVPPGTVVGLVADRGMGVPVAILGILKHGCAYLPVDPSYPAARRQFMLEDVGVGSVLVEDGPAGSELRLHRVAGSEQVAVPADTAYIIYTSGSTGRPKGVLVRQAHVCALLDGAASRYDFHSSDVWTMYHSPSFDISVWELWGAWNSGGAVLVVPTAFVRTAPMLVALLERSRASVLTLVPTAFLRLTQALERNPVALPQLREIVLAGEPIKPEVVNRWRELRLSAARIVNMYGITEITVHATFCELPAPVTARYPGTTPIGRPFPHLSLHLLDEDGAEVPSGVAGEILVEGDSVADGYVRRPEATRSRFRPGPGGRPAYRSGDFAIRDEDGELHFVSRRDDQVQIRGYRVEPGEVSAAVETHPDVVACVVTAPERVPGEPELTAHCVLRSAAGEDSHLMLRRHLADQLPAYLMPSAFVFHASLPMTPNGKVDRAALDAASDAGSRGGAKRPGR